MARRSQTLTTLLIIALSTFFGITFIWQFRNQAEGTRHPTALAEQAHKSQLQQEHGSHLVPDAVPLVDPSLLHSPSSSPKIENATLKAALGNSAWHLFHTTMATFPEKPSTSDSEALRSYIHLFARLYPCGDCARHFQGILKEYPPQVSSRKTAAAWACFVHNEVNTSLKKEKFDCKRLGEVYDCGCGEEKTGEGEDGAKGSGEKGLSGRANGEVGLVRGV